MHLKKEGETLTHTLTGSKVHLFLSRVNFDDTPCNDRKITKNGNYSLLRMTHDIYLAFSLFLSFNDLLALK